MARSYEMLVDAVAHASEIHDTQALLVCAVELDELQTTSASALAARVRGVVERLLGNYGQALEYFHQARELFAELGDRDQVAVVTANMASIYGHRGSYAQALEMFQSALLIQEELGNARNIAGIRGNIGNMHQAMGQYDAALENFQQALRIHEEHGHRVGVAYVTSCIGNVYGSRGEYRLALEQYHRALPVREELGDRSGVAHTTGNIGSIHVFLNEYPNALEHFHRALAIHQELQEKNGIARTIGNIGLVYGGSGSYEQALEYFNQAVEMHQELGDRGSVAHIKACIGSTYRDQGKLQEAIGYLEEALSLYRDLNERNGIASSTGSLVDLMIECERYAEAEVYLESMKHMEIVEPEVKILVALGTAAMLDRDHHADEALAVLLEAAEIARSYGLHSLLATIHKRLRDRALKMNDFAMYVEHNNAYTRITEDISGKETATKLAMQEKQREIDAREKEHAKHMAVLHSTLPRHIADRVARGEVVNDTFDDAAVLFLDVVGFTTHSGALGARDLVELLQRIFTMFDTICAAHDVMKIKTIGDSYMAVAFPSDHHIENLAAVALAMQDSAFTWPHTGERVQFRIGLHCGPVVAGVLGTERMQYDVWGDTVNVASRMESTGLPGRVHISAAFANAIENREYRMEERGMVDVKGKGMMKTYWLWRP